MYKDYYAILGITPQATVAEIKIAYRNWAKQLHPDIVGADAAKQLQFAEIKKAYETLTNPTTRYQFHEERWLLKSQGKQYDNYTPVTEASILKDCLALEREIHFMDSNRNYEVYIATKLSEVLSKEHLHLLIQKSDVEINKQIVSCVIKLIPNLPIDFLPIVQEKLSILDISENEESEIQTAIKKRKTNAQLQRYKWVLVLVVTLFLLGVIKWMIIA